VNRKKLWRVAVRGVLDEEIRRPLWEFPPDAASAVLSERAKRHILQNDPEPTGDSEYS
jgi:hypothetical protein